MLRNLSPGSARLKNIFVDAQLFLWDSRILLAPTILEQPRYFAEAEICCQIAWAPKHQSAVRAKSRQVTSFSHGCTRFFCFALNLKFTWQFLGKLDWPPCSTSCHTIGQGALFASKKIMRVLLIVRLLMLDDVSKCHTVCSEVAGFLQRARGCMWSRMKHDNSE